MRRTQVFSSITVLLVLPASFFPYSISPHTHRITSRYHLRHHAREPPRRLLIRLPPALIVIRHPQSRVRSSSAALARRQVERRDQRDDQDSHPDQHELCRPPPPRAVRRVHVRHADPRH
ncbi:hypothetical protein F4820DRAFT_407939, partial [Hypoxylon rubiginosum]